MVISVVKFFILGLLWLLIFSIPINAQERVFHVCFNNVVESKPVEWTIEKIQSAFHYAGVKVFHFGSKAFEEKE